MAYMAKGFKSGSRMKKLVKGKKVRYYPGYNKKGLKRKPITAKQKAARKRNIAIARRYRKHGSKKLTRRSRLVASGGSAVTSAAKYRGYDKRVAVKTKRAKKIYAKEFRASYTSKRNRGKSKAKRAAIAHKNALKWATGVRTWGMGGGSRVTYRIPGKTYRRSWPTCL